jgi:hypothetical protein
MRVWTGFNWLMVCYSGGSFKHGIEVSSSIKAKRSQVLKKVSMKSVIMEASLNTS